MENINELLEKYFRGETTLAEENELKQYFAARNVAKEHTPYQALFLTFGRELQEKCPAPLLKVEVRQKTTKRFWIKTFAYSGIAASIMLAIWVQRPVTNDDYAVISGKRIEDSEYAQKYAEKKLKKANQILKSSMMPLRSFETVRHALEPMQKINQPTETSDDIQKK